MQGKIGYMIGVMNEQARISELVDRLTRTYTAVTPETVAEVVHDQHVTFDGAPLREYVPLFVERKARTALDELSVPYS